VNPTEKGAINVARLLVLDPFHVSAKQCLAILPRRGVADRD